MDVRCPRCSTEYEFDDALVSERGTTVKCTNCGYQFKVFPPDSSAPGTPERWIVRTSAGRELVYTSLKDLQRGISQRQVSPDDLLSRGGHPPRPLAEIAELAPFFERSGGAVRIQHTPAYGSAVGEKNTSLGIGPERPGGVSAPPPKPGSGPPPKPRTPPPKPERRETPPLPTAREEAHGPLPPKPTPPPPKPSTPPPPVAVAAAPSVPDDIEPDPPTIPRNEIPEPPQPEPDSQRRSASDSVEQGEVVIKEAPVLTPTPSDVRDSYARDDRYTDPRYASVPPSRRAKSRWIVAAVLVGGVAVLGATVGRDYLSGRTGGASSSQLPETSSRAAKLLEQGRAALDEGDLEGAKEKFDKADVLVEGDPGVAAALAELAAARADIYWLKLRLLDPEETALVDTTNKQLALRVRKARRASHDAEKLGADRSDVVRARIDALRLAGKLSEARALVKKLTTDTDQPSTAYVLAALDLAEKEPSWSTVIERLERAAEAETGPGRARAALIYALIRTGKASRAQSELSKLEGFERPHALINELRSFVKRATSASDGGADAGDIAIVDPSTLPTIDSDPDKPAPAGEDDGKVNTSGDFRALLKKAAAANAAGNLATAEAYYKAVLAKQPGNTEALAGLGDIAKKRNDPELAKKHYDDVLEKNPNYLPALMASADAKWDSGDKAGAIALYQRVVSQVGASHPYGAKASARIAQGAGSSEGSGSESKGSEGSGSEGSGSEGSGSEGSEGSGSKSSEPPPKKDEPHIDTSDLPGF